MMRNLEVGELVATIEDIVAGAYPQYCNMSLFLTISVRNTFCRSEVVHAHVCFFPDIGEKLLSFTTKSGNVGRELAAELDRSIRPIFDPILMGA